MSISRESEYKTNNDFSTKDDETETSSNKCKERSDIYKSDKSNNTHKSASIKRVKSTKAHHLKSMYRKLEAEQLKAKAKPISSVEFLKNKVVLSEFQTRITIGREWPSNLAINSQYVGNIHCMLFIRRTNSCHIKEYETVIKNGWNSEKTFVNNTLLSLKPNEELVLRHDDRILIKAPEGFIEIKFIEDAKVEKDHLRAQIEERYHVVNNENDRNSNGPRLMDCYF